MTLSKVNRPNCAQLAAKTIGILVSLCGLFLLGTFIVFLVAVIAGGRLELSVDGVLVSLGLLFIAGLGLFFIWTGFCILVLKSIPATSFTLLTVIPALFAMGEAVHLIKTSWKKPAEGYGFVTVVCFMSITAAVFLVSHALTLKVLLEIFRKAGYLET